MTKVIYICDCCGNESQDFGTVDSRFYRPGQMIAVTRHADMCFDCAKKLDRLMAQFEARAKKRREAAESQIPKYPQHPSRGGRSKRA